MNLVKKKGKKQQKQKKVESPPAEEAEVEMESFDDFLNTLSDDEEDGEESQQSADTSDSDEANESALTKPDSDEAELGEDDDDDGDEGQTDEEAGEDDDDDDGSLDLNAELEKSLEDEKVVKAPGRSPGPTADESADDDDVDYFVRDEEPDDENTQEETAASLKKSLAALQETDPDFFSYLKENDAELLNFEASDDEEGEESDDDEEDEGAHVPPDQLEIASDSEAESEEEHVADKKSAEYRTKVTNYINRRVVNLSVISHWEKQLSTTRDLTIFMQVVDAFESAVETVLQDKEAGGGDGSAPRWKVEGSSNFNALIRLCIRHVFSFCTRYLCNTNNTSFATKSFTKAPLEVRKKNDGSWTKLRPRLRTYMNALVQFLRSMGNPEAVTSVLRHCQVMAGFWAIFTTKAQKLLRTLIAIWSTGEDSARIAAFVTILRMTNYNQDFFLERVLKQMYIAFVSNCKFTTPNSWPAINFMRTSLVEIYLLDTRLAYTIAFPFVRQLAIHLRNATMAGSENNASKSESGGAGNSGEKEGSSGKGKRPNRSRARGVSADGVLGSKTEATRIVVSWQFLHSIHLWAQLLGEAAVKGDQNLELLIHPVVQIAVGTVRLVPTRKHIPLRFHITRILTELQSQSGVFIPILPLAIQVLSLSDFSHKTAAKFSVRPLNLQCCLKADPAETGYHKAVADAVYDSILGVCHTLGSDIAFPELMTQPLHSIKLFLRIKCKNGEVARRFKTLVEKIEANSTFINERRAAAMDAGRVHLGDDKSVQVLRLEMENSNPPPPIIAFAQEWRQMHARQMAKLQRASIGGSGKHGGDETREERLIPKSSAKATTATGKKKSQGEKQRAKIEKVLFADDDSENDSEDKAFDEDDSDEEAFRTKFDEELETAEESGKAKKKKKRRTAQNDDDDELDENEDEEVEQPKKKKSKKMKQKGKKAKKSAGSSNTWENDETGDIQDEIVDFDNFGDSD